LRYGKAEKSDAAGAGVGKRIKLRIFSTRDGWYGWLLLSLKL